MVRIRRMRRILSLLRDERGVELVPSIYILGIDVLGGLAIWLLGTHQLTSALSLHPQTILFHFLSPMIRQADNTKEGKT